MGAIDTKTAGKCPVSGKMTLQGDETRLNPLIHNNPFPFYRALRAEKPVYYDPKLDVYLVTRYEDVLTILEDPITYSLEHGYQERYANGFVDELPLNALKKYEEELYSFIESRHPDVFRDILKKRELDGDLRGKMTKALEEFKSIFKP